MLDDWLPGEQRALGARLPYPEDSKNVAEIGDKHLLKIF